MYVLPAQTASSWWPSILPGAVIEQSYDMTNQAQITEPGQVASLSAQIAPSGSGEMIATALVVVGTTLTITLESYFGNRVYSVLFTATLHNGQVVVWIVNQGVGNIPPGYAGFVNAPLVGPDGIVIGPDGNPVQQSQPYFPINPVYGLINANPPPASPGFGSEITWMPSSNNVASSSIGSSLVLSPIGITIANVQCNSTTVGGWLLLLDAATAPGSPSAVVPLRAWQMTPGETLDKAFSPSLVTVNGAVLLYSSTGPLTYTASATAYFAGEVM